MGLGWNVTRLEHFNLVLFLSLPTFSCRLKLSTATALDGVVIGFTDIGFPYFLRKMYLLEKLREGSGGSPKN